MSFFIADYRISPKYTSEKIVTYVICSMSFHSAVKIDPFFRILLSHETVIEKLRGPQLI